MFVFLKNDYVLNTDNVAGIEPVHPFSKRNESYYSVVYFIHPMGTETNAIISQADAEILIMGLKQANERTRKPEEE